MPSDELIACDRLFAWQAKAAFASNPEDEALYRQQMKQAERNLRQSVEGTNRPAVKIRNLNDAE